MTTRLLDHLSAKLSERVKTLSEAMANGVCKDYSEYTHCAGQVRGLLVAQYEISDLVQKLKDQDE